MNKIHIFVTLFILISLLSGCNEKTERTTFINTIEPIYEIEEGDNLLLQDFKKKRQEVLLKKKKTKKDEILLFNLESKINLFYNHNNANFKSLLDRLKYTSTEKYNEENIMSYSFLYTLIKFMEKDSVHKLKGEQALNSISDMYENKNLLFEELN